MPIHVYSVTCFHRTADLVVQDKIHHKDIKTLKQREHQSVKCREIRSEFEHSHGKVLHAAADASLIPAVLKMLLTRWLKGLHPVSRENKT